MATKTDNDKINLKIKIAFTDKYTNINYNINDIVSFDKKRAEEILNDSQKLAEIAE